MMDCHIISISISNNNNVEIIGLLSSIRAFYPPHKNRVVHKRAFGLYFHFLFLFFENYFHFQKIKILKIYLV